MARGEGAFARGAALLLAIVSLMGLEAAAPAAVAGPRPAVNPRPAPIAELSFKAVEGGGQTLEGRIGDQTGAFLFDSGWGVSAVSPQMAARLGCKPWGRLTGFRATGERADLQRCNGQAVQLAGWRADLATLAVIDLMRFMPKSPVHYVGALGLDAFDGQVITIRSKAQRLIVESPASARTRTAHAVEVPIKLVRDVQGFSLTVNVGVPTSAGMAWFEMDTGNRGPLLVADHVASLLGLKTGKEDVQPLRTPLAPGVVLDGSAYVTDLIMDGNVGHTFLDRWDVTLDLKHGRAWLAPADGAPPG